MILRFFTFVLVALSLCLLALISAITTMHFAIHGAEVTVPDFRGQELSTVMRKAIGMNLEPAVDGHYYSATTPVGHVLTQSPLPGTRVRTGWTLRMIDSLGPQRVAIPRITGDSERIATLEIRRLGLDIGTIARMPYTGSNGDTVIAQSPQPGAANVDRPNLGFLLGLPLPAEPAFFVMPNLEGSSWLAAAPSLRAAHLNLLPPLYRAAGIPAVPPVDAAGVPQAPRPPLLAGTVLAQQPDAGVRIDAATPIQLTMAE